MQRLSYLMTIWLAAATLAMAQQQREGCHVEEIVDQDGDPQVLMESEWISMHLMPSMQSMVVRFVFRPTGNDILDEVNPKFVMGGHGLLQDNFWGQDWRFSEFRNRYYDYQIVKNTPEEVAVRFETLSEGWMQSAESGIRSKLWSNIRLKRTVRLRKGAPYFLFDLELANEDENSKLPLMWVHNGSLVDPVQGDFVFRPSTRGVREMGKIGEIKHSEGDHYIYDFNEGWSARIAPVRKEGLVYLMDYDYVQFLYNSGTNTAEWVHDNVLIPPDRPWKGRTYILPVVGLSRVDFASEHFIIAVHPRREKGQLELVYRVTGSYEQVKRITFNTEIGYDHYLGEGIPDDPKTRKVDPVIVEGLGVAPVEGRVVINDPPADPLLLTIKAHMELPDGTITTRQFQVFHVGEYKFGANIRQDMSTPVARLDRPVQKPWVPMPKANMQVNRQGWDVFALLGNHARLLQLREILRGMEGVDLAEEEDIGYTPGFQAYDLGLTDYPYDYERLFNYRVVVWHNSRLDVGRMVGASVLAAYCDAGGGLVMTGGDNTFAWEYSDPENPLNQFVPISARPDNLYRGALQLNSPESSHPIFKGIDLENLPWAYWTHDVELKEEAGARVLMRVGDRPFIVESNRGDQRTLVVLAAPFGDPAEFDNLPTFWSWSQWPALFANIVRYAGHDLN